MPDLSSEPRDWTYVPVVEAWSQTLDHQVSLSLLLNHQCVLDSISFFSSVFWDYHTVLLSSCVKYGGLYGFRILNQPCIPGVNHSLSWSIVHFTWHCIQLAKFLSRIFASMFMKVCIFLLLYLSGFGIRAVMPSQNELRVFPVPKIMEDFVLAPYDFFLKRLRHNLPIKSFGLGIFFVWGYFIFALPKSINGFIKV